MKIALISDIHYRALDRHKEYRYVFNQVFEELRIKIKPDAIFFGGDIYHSKTQLISPEVIDELTWMFKEASSIAPLTIILGNHDGNINNQDRQDAITPILTAINNSKITCYKQSGVYPVPNNPAYNYCIFSIFDKAGWDKVKPEEGKFNIAAFHGRVDGAVADNGMIMDGEINNKFFAGYDAVFLGDLHKHQIVRGNNKVVYPGSLIQQNYGEDVLTGYLVWNLNTNGTSSWEFKSILPYRPFITINWAKTVTATLDEIELSFNYPGGVNVKVKSQENITREECYELTSKLKTLGATEVVFDIDFKPTIEQFQLDKINFKSKDLRNINTQMELLKEFYSEMKLTSEEWTSLEKIVDYYLKAAISEENILSNSKWTLKSFEFSNLFIYGEDNKINFDKLNGTIGVFAPNRSGKSSLVGALTFGLFNATDRTSDKKSYHIINERKNDAKVSLDIEMNDEIYSIVRHVERTPSKDKKYKSTTSLDFTKLDKSGNKINLNGVSRMDTDASIHKHFGTIDDFFLTAFAKQGDVNKFIECKSTDRKSYLSRFLDLSLYDKMLDLIRKESNDDRTILRKIDSKDWTAFIQEAREKIINIKKSYQDNKDLIQLYQKELEDLNTQLISLQIGNGTDPAQIILQEQRITKLQTDKSQIEKEIIDFETELKSYEEKLKIIETIKNKIPIENVKNILTTIKEVAKEVSEKQHQIKLLEQQEEQYKKSTKVLQEIPCGTQFPTCKFIKNAHEAVDKLTNCNIEIKILQTQLSETQEKFEKLQSKDVEKTLEKYNTLLREEAVNKSKFESLTKNILSYNKRLEKINKEIISEIERLENLKSNSIEEKLFQQQKEFKNQITIEKEKIQKLERENINNIQTETSQLEKIDVWIKEKKEYDELVKRCNIYDLLIQAWSSRGLPSKIIKSQLPVINQEISKILSGIVNFEISIEQDVDGTENSLDVFIDYGDSKRIIELASGMEKMISSLAIRVALMNVSTISKPNMFIIDEGFDVLDAKSLEECLPIFQLMKKWFKHVMIITHKTMVKNVADIILEINKVGVDAQVRYE